MKHTRMGRSTARMVEREGAERLADLPVDEVQQLFKPAGLLLFRGFEAGGAPFKAFASQFTLRFLRDLGGSKTIDSAGDYIQTLVPAGNPQDLHCESARGPNRPTLLWFHCITPARVGGETTYADGVEIWDALDGSTQQLFLDRRVKYTELLPPEQWRVGLKLFFIAEIEHLQLGGTTFRFRDDGRMQMEFVTSAVGRTHWTGERTFTNSLTGPYPGAATFEDGAPIPPSAIAEIKSVHERLQEQVAWEPGDIVMLDNSRFMHGRRAFTDRGRSHLTLMGMANFD